MARRPPRRRGLETNAWAAAQGLGRPGIARGSMARAAAELPDLPEILAAAPASVISRKFPVCGPTTTATPCAQASIGAIRN